MSRLNGKAPPDALEELDDVIAELEGQEWDEVSGSHITVNVVDQTGKFKAMDTVPDNPRPKQESLPEKVIDAVAELPDKAKTWSQASVAIAIVVCVTLLAAFAAYLRWG